jgi:uncharacterized protein YecE (DUF72 family)
MATIRVGVSGWSYDEWRGDFYPPDLPIKQQLRYASRRFDSIEVNGSFYSLLTPETYERIRDESPRGHTVALKGSRFITHNKKLNDVETPLANFFASGLLQLGRKLGPIVWQLAEQTRFQADRLNSFLGLLPKDSRAAARLARKHDARVDGRSRTAIGANHRIRHVLEARHDSFFTPEAVRILRRHGVALAISDAPDWPMTEELTAGFVYIRLHGSREIYVSRYGDEELEHWAHRIALWADGGEPADARRITRRLPPRRKSRDVYVYFDNTAKAHAPRDALRLVRMLKPACVGPRSAHESGDCDSPNPRT